MGKRSGGAAGKKRKNIAKHKLKRSKGSKGSTGSGKGKGSGRGRAKKGLPRGKPEWKPPAEEGGGVETGTQVKSATGKRKGAKGGAKGRAKGSGAKVHGRGKGRGKGGLASGKTAEEGKPSVNGRGKCRRKGRQATRGKTVEGGKSSARKRRAPMEPSPEGGGEEEKAKKKKKLLTAKQKRRKEVTMLYSELTNPGRKRKPSEIVASILQLLKQRDESLAKGCLKLVGSKVVQACLKWGSRDQRREVLTMLKADIPELVLNRYGHAVVLKLLRYTTRTAAERAPTTAEESTARSQNLRDLLESLSGKTLLTTFFHRYGCRVINAIYFSDALKATRRRQILHEVAVPTSLALTRPEFKSNRTLRQLLAPGLLPEGARETLLAHLQKAIERAVNKELLGVDVVHLLLQAFCEVATEQQLRDLAEKSMGGAAYLLSSKPGAEALIYLLGVANAKQRRAFCKDLKGKFVALATNSVDYVVMMRLCSTVDDTVLLAKSVLTEWIPELSQISFDKHGGRVLSWLLGADAPNFTEYERTFLDLPAPTSLKAAETRRTELLRALRPPLRVVLLARPLEAAADSFAKDVLIAYLAGAWDEELAEALVAAAETEADKDDNLGLLCNSEVSITTLTALLGLDAAEVRSTLAEPLWHRCLQPRLLKAIQGAGAFLLLRLVQSCAGKELAGAVRLALNERRGEVEATLAGKGADEKTAKAARKLLDVENVEKQEEEKKAE